MHAPEHGFAKRFAEHVRSVSGSLDGIWDVKRAGGWLPPLVGVRKEISGGRGVTRIGPFPGAPFDVVGLELRYRFPFTGFVDVLEPRPGGYDGRARARGREFGRFRMTRSPSPAAG